MRLHLQLQRACAMLTPMCARSGIANMVLIAELARSYPERRHLKYSFYVKLALIILGVCSIIAIAGRSLRCLSSCSCLSQFLFRSGAYALELKLMRALCAGLYGYADAETPVSGEESTYEDGPYSGVAALEWCAQLLAVGALCS